MKTMQEIRTKDTIALPIFSPTRLLNKRLGNGHLRIEKHKARTQDNITATKAAELPYGVAKQRAVQCNR